jgi:hypothetical protein
MGIVRILFIIITPCFDHSKDGNARGMRKKEH